MNVDHVLQTMNRLHVEYLLIGGMNYLLRHQPVLTYDIDLWIQDSEDNRTRCEQALADLSAEWGMTESDWSPVVEMTGGWLDRQSVFCLTSPHGAIDIFRGVSGLKDWKTCRAQAVSEQTAAGVEYFGLSDADMLACQLALDESHRKQQRIDWLQELLGHGSEEDPRSNED